MRVDPFEQFDQVVTKQAKEETPTPDAVFGPATLNSFFENPVWAEIDKVLELRQTMLMSLMIDESVSREEDLKRKGQLVEVIFMRNIRQVFEPEEEGE